MNIGAGVQETHGCPADPLCRLVTVLALGHLFAGRLAGVGFRAGEQVSPEPLSHNEASELGADTLPTFVGVTRKPQVPSTVRSCGPLWGTGSVCTLAWPPTPVLVLVSVPSFPEVQPK